jgi:drug/metabolite transporter (DMT)-like permease
MLGLTRSSAATASLLLNLEGVLTALLAWLVFKENADRRVVLGMALIVLGSVVLSWPGESTLHTLDSITGPLLISLACLFWALDNNLTRRVANVDAVLLAAVKGLVAAGVNVSLALALGQTLPGWSVSAPVLLIGFLGYGLSLVLFVLALRGLGSARTGAYFGAAPFMGAALALGVLGEASPSGFWIAGLLMAAGLWLHLTERHEHPHWHGDLLHSHAHFPDMEHRHEHP